MINKSLNIFSPELIFLSIIGLIIASWNKIPNCNPISLGFDEQSFLFWKHVRSLDLIPFKDFFYPYGLLFYLKIDDSLWLTISIVLVVVSIGSIFLFFRNIFEDRLYTYTFFLAFCLFVGAFLGFDSFLRYSPIIFVAYVASTLTYRGVILNKIPALLIGLTLGLLFSLINDLFFYSFFVSFSLTLFYLVFKHRKVDKKVFLFAAYSLFGFLIGAFPLLIYLNKNDALGSFVENYRLLKDISIFAKVPFPPTLKSFENLFVIGTLIIFLLSLTSDVIWKKKKSFSFYLKLSLIIAIVFLEQKNIVRSFYQQLSFIGLIAFSFLANDFKKKLEQIKIQRKFIYFFVLNLLFLIFISIYLDRGLSLKKSFFQINKINCNQIKLAEQNQLKLKKYEEVKRFLLTKKNPTIFSFPGDPIFYLLLDQKPPYYPSIYEATPLYAQEKMIEYIKSSKVNFVILNQKSSSIQDGVPDKIRGKLLYDYISKNFVFDKKIDSFLILRKK